LCVLKKQQERPLFRVKGSNNGNIYKKPLWSAGAAADFLSLYARRVGDIYTTHTSSTTPHSTFQPRSFCPAARRAAAPIHFAKSVHNNYFLSRGRSRSSNAFCHTGNLIVLMRHSACTGKVSSRRRLSTPMRRPK
jgi:hypothetical protein